jgi:hypothetical protein
VVGCQARRYGDVAIATLADARPAFGVGKYVPAGNLGNPVSEVRILELPKFTFWVSYISSELSSGLEIRSDSLNDRAERSCQVERLADRLVPWGHTVVTIA